MTTNSHHVISSRMFSGPKADWITSSSSSGDTTPNSRDDEAVLTVRGFWFLGQHHQHPQAPSLRSDSLPCMTSMWTQHAQQQHAQHMLIANSDNNSQLLQHIAEVWVVART